MPSEPFLLKELNHKRKSHCLPHGLFHCPSDLHSQPNVSFLRFTSALPEDEWFVETAKSLINKLFLGTEGSETSEVDQDHINLHGHIVLESDDDDDDDTDSSLSSLESIESFASASMGELDSPRNSDD